MTPEQTIFSIRSKVSCAVLLVHPDDELSARARQTFLALETKLKSRGFTTSVLDVTSRTSVSDELACVRAPQLRIFIRGKLQCKLVGLFDDSDIDVALRTVG